LPVDKRRRKLPKFIDGELVLLDNTEDDNENEKKKIETERLDNDSSSNSGGMGNNVNITRAEKVEILKRDLTGLHRRTKFREGVKWL